MLLVREPAGVCEAGAAAALGLRATELALVVLVGSLTTFALAAAGAGAGAGGVDDGVCAPGPGSLLPPLLVAAFDLATALWLSAVATSDGLLLGGAVVLLFGTGLTAVRMTRGTLGEVGFAGGGPTTSLPGESGVGRGARPIPGFGAALVADFALDAPVGSIFDCAGVGCGVLVEAEDREAGVGSNKNMHIGQLLQVYFNLMFLKMLFLG